MEFVSLKDEEKRLLFKALDIPTKTS